MPSVRNRINADQMAELEKIRLKHGGVLHPDAIVASARAEKSTLHRMFTWEDTEAAKLWRLHQAARLLRMVVTVSPIDNKTTRMYVSLSTDRLESGGYRAIEDVVANEKSYKILLADAMDELATFHRKYARLTELQAVFDAMTAARKKFVGA